MCLLVTVGVLASAGCGTTVEAGADDGGDAGPPSDAGDHPATHLELTGDPRLGLVFGETATFEVRYTDVDDEPIAGGEVRFALDGNAHDSTLLELRAQTGADGVARGTIMAGSTPAAFRIRVAADGAAAVFLDVSVSNRGFGAMRVELAPYEGERAVDHVVVNVFAETSCEAEGLLERTADRSKRLVLGDGGARFLGLPADLTYAAAVRGETTDGEAVAWGCVDEVQVRRDEEVTTEVLLSDLPLALGGEYDTVAAVSAPEAATTYREAVLDAGLAPVSAAGGEAELLLDAIEQALRDAGEIATAETFATEREGGDLGGLLAADLEADDVGPGLAVERMASIVSERIGRISLEGRLSVDPEADRLFVWEIEQLLVGVADPDRPPLSMDVDEFGIPLGVSFEGGPLEGEDLLALDPLRVRLPLGTLARTTRRAVLEEGGDGSFVDWLELQGGCNTLERWADEQPLLDGSCDAACVRSACTDTMVGLAADIDEAVTDLDVSRDQIVLTGTLELREETGDLQVDEMASDSLSGLWVGDLPDDEDPVAAVLRATRRP